MSIKLFVEGGGDAKTLKIACRKGFRCFVERAGLGGRMPGIVACGSRQDAYRSFRTALQSGDGFPILVVDAEEPLTAAGPWEHLHHRDRWIRPNPATDEQCHLMVQVMESWFLADKPALALFYGQGFRESSLPQNPSVEQIAKADVLNGLDRATRYTTKGRYRKGSLSFDILGSIDPGAVEQAAPYARRLLETLRAASPA